MFNLLNIKRFFLFFVFFYFVSMMIVMGNGHSFLGRYLAFFYIPVANSVGLNTTWNFFSPDPANTMYFRTTIIFEDDYGNTTSDSIEQYFPASKDQGGDFRLDLRRFSYAMRWLAIDNERVKKFYVPMLCKTYLNAKKIQVEFIVKPIPALEKVMTLKNADFESLLREEEVGKTTYDCA